MTISVKTISGIRSVIHCLRNLRKPFKGRTCNIVNANDAFDGMRLALAEVCTLPSGSAFLVYF